MRCRKCGCPAAAELFNGLMCFNPKCVFYDPRATEKAVWDSFNYLVNDDPIFDLRRFLDDGDATE